MGKDTGIVWLVRVAQPAVGGDQTVVGTVRLVSDSDGSVIYELPLAVDATYNPARLVLDSKYSDNSADTTPHFEILDGKTTLVDDVLNVSTPPLTLEAGSYMLRAYLTTQPGAGCIQSISINALMTGGNMAYKATFKSSTCSWAPFDPSQF